MKNQKMNNKGLTLVELMVAVTISIIVIGAIWQFVLISTRTYENQRNITELQQEVQQTMNHIENLVIDADRAVKFIPEENTSTLEIYSATKVSKLIWNKADKTLTYTETPVDKGVLDTDATESALLASGVEDFSADMSKIESDQIIKVAMEFSRKGKTYNAARNIAIRNVVQVNNVVADVYKDDLVTTPQITIAINNPVGEAGIEPGDTAVFQAIVNGTDDQTVIWTILPAESRDTAIDISSGKLYVGVDENETNQIQEDKITVVATLASNRDIFATAYVSVAPQPAVSITVNHFPSAVVYGKSYELQATANPSVGTTLRWSVVSGNATIDTTGGTPKLKLATAPKTLSELVQVKVEALVNGNPVREQILEAKVRQPEFTITAIDYNSKSNPAKFDRGSKVTLKADWSGAYANRAGFIEYDDFYGNEQYIKYANGYFANEKINWTVTYTKGGTTTPITVAADGTFNMPIDMDVTRVTVKGVSQNFPFVTYQKVLDLATPTLTLKVSVGGETVTGMLPLKETIKVEPILTGLYAGKYNNWSITGPGGTVNPSIAGDKKSATFILNDVEKYMGKTIEVSVKEETSGLTATATLPVVDVIECDKSLKDPNNWSGNDYDYLFALKYKKSSTSFMYTYPAQNPFFIQLPGTNTDKYKIEYTFFTKSGATINNYSEVMRFTVKEKGILCEPIKETRRTAFDYDNFSHIIIHVDDISTGTHVGMYRLEPTMANFRDTTNGVSYWIPYNESNLDDLKKVNVPDTSVTRFINFYGRSVTGSEFNGANPSNYPQKTSYKYSYVYKEEVTSNWWQTTRKDTYTLTLNLNNEDVYTKKYTKNNGTWS